jgi:hypothetical protein
MALAQINLQVPANRTSCATWLYTQEPPVVADALCLCEAAIGAVRRDVSEGESSKLLKIHHLQIKKLEDVLEREKVLHEEALLNAKQKAENEIEDIKRRHSNFHEDWKRKAISDQQEHERSLQQQQDAFQQKIIFLEKKLQDLDAMFTKTRIEKQAELEDALQRERGRLEVKYEGEIRDLQVLLQSKQCNEAQAALAEARKHEEDLRKKQEDHAKAMEGLREQHNVKEALLKGLLEKLEIQLAQLSEVNKEDRARLEKLVQQQNDVMTRYSGISTRGQLGEKTVIDIFSRLQLGEYQDDRMQKEDDFADGLWVWQPSTNTPRLSCLVEVKDTKVLHSQNDISKFQKNMRAARLSNRANAGLFLSLSARYPGKPSLQITIENNMPVVYASRSEDDAIPVACMVEVAFRAMAEVWPHICRQRGEGVQLSVQAAAEQFEEQISQCESLSKHISKISDVAKTLKNQVTHLERIRDKMIAGIEGVRVNHPSLVPEILEDVSSEASAEEIVDPWTTPGALQLIQSIRDAKRGSRYPKEHEVSLKGDAFLFSQQMPNAFLLGVARLKKEYGSKKRRLDDAVNGEDDSRGNVSDAVNGEDESRGNVSDLGS